MQNIDDCKNSTCMQILLLFICTLLTCSFLRNFHQHQPSSDLSVINKRETFPYYP